MAGGTGGLPPGGPWGARAGLGATAPPCSGLTCPDPHVEARPPEPQMGLESDSVSLQASFMTMRSPWSRERPGPPSTGTVSL